MTKVLDIFAKLTSDNRISTIKIKSIDLILLTGLIEKFMTDVSCDAKLTNLQKFNAHANLLQINDIFEQEMIKILPEIAYELNDPTKVSNIIKKFQEDFFS